MTHEELDALPVMGEIEWIIEERDGKRVRVPKLTVGALYQAPDQPLFHVDADGQRWMVGTAYGRTWKRRLRNLEELS